LAALGFLSAIEAKMKKELVSALKNQLVVALIVAGTITIAIPIFVCGLISTLLEFSLSLATSKTLAVAENLENWRKLPADMDRRTLHQQRTSVFERPSAKGQ
jgi:hypothetical protein